MARQIINTGTVPNDGTGDPLRTALTKTNENFEEIYPITEPVTKTVAADGMPSGVQDFDDFHTAMTWACAQLIQGGVVTLSLEDGTHYTGGSTDVNAEWSCLYAVTSGNHVFVESVSSDESLCTITVPSDVPEQTTVFLVRFGYIGCDNLTLDPSAGGHATPETISCLAARYYGVTYVSNCTITNCRTGINLSDSAYGNLYGLTIDTCSFAGMFVGAACLAKLSSSSFTDCVTAVNIAYGDFSAVNISSIALSGNTTDYNVPLNEIQLNGAYISDKSVPLVATESSGTTAERPTARQIGHGYFDTTLGYEINWDGTNWVDSTGTTV